MVIDVYLLSLKYAAQPNETLLPRGCGWLHLVPKPQTYYRSTQQAFPLCPHSFHLCICFCCVLLCVCVCVCVCVCAPGTCAVVGGTRKQEVTHLYIHIPATAIGQRRFVFRLSVRPILVNTISKKRFEGISQNLVQILIWTLE